MKLNLKRCLLPEEIDTFFTPKIKHFFKVAGPSAPPVVDISDEATATDTADTSATADTNNNSSTDDFRDNQQTSGPSNDPEEAMLKTKGTKKKSKG